VGIDIRVNPFCGCSMPYRSSIRASSEFNLSNECASSFFRYAHHVD